jgi:hypothetical protein
MLKPRDEIKNHITRLLTRIVRGEKIKPIIIEQYVTDILNELDKYVDSKLKSSRPAV